MTTHGCEQFDEICTLVAAGAATPEEEQALKVHLEQGCPACAPALRELTETAAGLAQTLTPLEPPPVVRAQILDAIAREMEIAPQRVFKAPSAKHESSLKFPWLWAPGWALATALGLILLWTMDTQRQAAIRHVSEIQALRLTLSEKEEALRLVQARQTQTVQLAGLAPSPSAFGKVFWNPQSNTGLLITYDLPPPPPGKIYQLWAIQGAAPVDVGIFSPDPQGLGAVKVKPLPDPRQAVQVFAITVEPAGGSPQPTGEMYLKGSVSTF